MYIQSIGHVDPEDSNKYTTGARQILRVHSSDKCVGEFCVIHNPSNHNMSNLPTYWRSDRYLMERICGHGVGHPDPDALAAMNELGIKDEGIHGCCGCCMGEAA